MEGDLIRAWKRSKKKRGWNDHDGIAGDLRERMIQLSPSPRSMGEELAAYFLPNPIVEDAVYRSEEVLDIFDGQWSSEDSALSDEDWAYIEELVNAWALEMDMNVVNQVMRVVVENARPGRGTSLPVK